MKDKVNYFGVTKSIAVIAASIVIIVAVSILFTLLEMNNFMVTYAIAMGLSVLAAIRLYKNSMGDFKLDINIRFLMIAPLVMVLPILLQFGLLSHLIALIPMPDFVLEMFEGLMDQNPTHLFIAVVILAPILEEILCRGIILKGLLKRHSPWKAIIVSSILFGVLHLNPWQFVSAFGIGMIAGWVYWKTKNLLLPILIHMANNLFFTWFGNYFGSEYTLDTPMIQVFGSAANQWIAISIALVLFMGIVWIVNSIVNRSEPLPTNSMASFEA